MTNCVPWLSLEVFVMMLMTPLTAFAPQRAPPNSSLAKRSALTSLSGFAMAVLELVLTHSRCKRENQNASNSAAFNEIATSQQLLLSRLPLGFAAFDQRPCFLPDTRSWRFMPAPKVRKNPKSDTAGEFISCGRRNRSRTRQSQVSEHRARLIAQVEASFRVPEPARLNSPAVSNLRQNQINFGNDNNSYTLIGREVR